MTQTATALTANQCAAKAYQRFYFFQDAAGALEWIDRAEELDPTQAARWGRERNEYGRRCDLRAPEAAPARDGSHGVDVTLWENRTA